MPHTQPNFIFINTDQQRFDTLGCYGSPVAKTPNIDRLADEGVRFANCYTTNPVCMPARASYFTGQYPSHHGVWQNGVPLSQHAELIHHRLRDAGYHAALIGKIHLENVWLRTEKHPAYGFDELTECEGDPYCKDDYFRWLDSLGLYEDYMAQFKRGGHKRGYTREICEAHHMNNWITGHVERYLDARVADNRPFFLSVGFFDPHHPFDPCEPYASMFDPAAMPMPRYRAGEEDAMTPLARAHFARLSALCLDPAEIRGTIAAYHATIAHVDAMVGRIMAALATSALAENTVVIFTSDHGELLGDHGLLHKGPYFFDPSVRVPLIYRFPLHYGIRGVDAGFTSHIDLSPTLAALAGIDGPALAQGAPLFDADGSLRPTPARDHALVEWREKPLNSTDPYLIARCLVTDQWKYVYYHEQDYGELYDRLNDPAEQHNLWRDPVHQSTIRDLRDRLLRALIDADPCPRRTDIF